MLTAALSRFRFVGPVWAVSLFVLLAVASGDLGAEPLPVGLGESLGEPASLFMPRVEHHLRHADRAREVDEWWWRVAPIHHLLKNGALEGGAGDDESAAGDGGSDSSGTLDPRAHHRLSAWLEERFAEWAVGRFFAEEATYSFDRLLSAVARSNLEHLYVVDENGAVELDSAGAPRMRRSEGLAEDRQAWSALVSQVLERELGAWDAAFEARRGALFSGIDPDAIDSDIGESESVAAALEEQFVARDERAGLAYRRELEAIMRLEERRFVAKRTRDQWSLRRSSEAETAERIAAELIAGSEKRLAAGISALEDGLDSEEEGDVSPVDVDAEAWRESFRQQFRAGMRRWDEAEERLIAERVEWERSAGVNLEEGEQVWADAYRRLRDARTQWQRELRSVIERGRLRWENEHEALEATIAEASIELERSIAEREASAQERIHNLVEMYAAARDTLRTALDSAGHWFGRLEYADDDPAAIGDREAIDAVLVAETAGAFDALADTFESRYFREAREALESAQAAVEEWYDRQGDGGRTGGSHPAPPGGWIGDGGPQPDPPGDLVDDLRAAEAELSRRKESARFAEWLVGRGLDSRTYPEWVRFDGHAAVALDLDAVSDELAKWEGELSVGVVDDIFGRLFSSLASPHLPSQLIFWSETWRRYEGQAEQAMADLISTYGVVLTGEPFAPGDRAVAFDELPASGGPDSIYLDEYQIELMKSRATEQYWEHQLSTAESVYDYATDTSSDRATEAETQEAFDAALAGLESARAAYDEAVAELAGAGHVLAGDRERLTQLVAAIDEEQRRLAAARAEYRSTMDLYLSESFDFYKQQIADYFEELAAMWGLTHDSDGGEEWRALVEYRHARASYEAESRYASAWDDIAKVVEAIAGSEYERWEFSDDPDEFEASLAAFHESDSAVLSRLHERWRAVRIEDAAAAEAVRIEIVTLAGRGEAIARAEVEELEEQLALLTAPSREAWLERSIVEEALLEEHGLHSADGSYEALGQALRAAERREEARWLARRAGREREAIELVLSISGDSAEPLSVAHFMEAADSVGAAGASRDLALVYWRELAAESEHTIDAATRSHLESAHAVLGEIVAALESLEDVPAPEGGATAQALRPIVESEEYASRFLSGASVFATGVDDLSRSIAEADRGAHRRLRSMRRAFERFGDSAPALARLRSDGALAALADRLDERDLLAARGGDGEIELVSPAELAGRLRSMSVDELGEWRTTVERTLVNAASRIDGAFSDEIVRWLDAAVAIAVADRAADDSPAYYRDLAAARAGRLDAAAQRMHDLDMLQQTVRDSAQSGRLRLAAAVERWRGEPDYAEERAAVGEVFTAAVSASVAAELALAYGDGVEPPDEAELHTAARAETSALLDGMGVPSIDEEFGEAIARQSLERYEAARLRFADPATVEWAALDEADRLLLTLDRWESKPPASFESLVGGVDPAAVEVLHAFAEWAEIRPDALPPDENLVEKWTIDRYFGGSAAAFDVYSVLESLEESVVYDGVEPLELERASVDREAIEQIDLSGYVEALAFLERRLERYEAIAADDELDFPDRTRYEADAADFFGSDAVDTAPVATFVDALWSQLSSATDAEEHRFDGDRSTFEAALRAELAGVLDAPPAQTVVDASFGTLAELDYLDIVSGSLGTLDPVDLVTERHLVDALFGETGDEVRERLSELLAEELAGTAAIEAAQRAFLADSQSRASLYSGAHASEDSTRFGLQAEFAERVRESVAAAGDPTDPMSSPEYESPRNVFLAEALDLGASELEELVAAERYVGALARGEEYGQTVSERLAEVFGISDAVEFLDGVEQLDVSVSDPYRRAARVAFLSDHGEPATEWLEYALELAHAGTELPDDPGSYFAATDIGTAYEAIIEGRSGVPAGDLDHGSGRVARSVQQIAHQSAGWLDGGAAEYAYRSAASSDSMFEIAAALDSIHSVGGYYIGSGRSGDLVSVLSYERSAAQAGAEAALGPLQRLIDEQIAAMHADYETAGAQRDLYLRLAAGAERSANGVYAARSFNESAYLPGEELDWSIVTTGLDSPAASPEESFVLARFGQIDDWSGQERVARENAFARASGTIERMYLDSGEVLEAASEVALSGGAPGEAFHLHFDEVEDGSLFDTAAGAVAGGHNLPAARRSTEMQLGGAEGALSGVRSRAEQIRDEISLIGGGIRAARARGEDQLVAALAPIEAEIGAAESEIAELDDAISDAIEAFEASNESYADHTGVVAERDAAVQAARLELRRSEAVLEFASSGYLGSTGNGTIGDAGENPGVAVDPADRVEIAGRRYNNARVARKALESLHDEERAAPADIDISGHPELHAYQDAFLEYRNLYEDRLAIRALEALFADALARQEEIVAGQFEEVNDILGNVLEPVRNGPDPAWSEFVEFIYDGEELPGFSLAWDAGGTEQLTGYFEAEHEEPRAPDNPEKEMFARHRHRWMLDTMQLIDDRGESVLADWGLALYHRDLELYEAVRGLLAYWDRVDAGGNPDLLPVSGETLRNRLGVASGVDLRDHRGRLEDLRDLLGARVERPSDKVDSGIADFLEGNLLRGEIDYNDYLRSESAAAHARVSGDEESRRLFEYYVGLNRVGGTTGEATYGILERTAGASMFEFIIGELSKLGRDQHNKAVRNTAIGVQLTATGLAMLPWPPAYIALGAAAGFYATAAGHAANSRSIGEVRRDASRDSRSERRDAGRGRRTLRDTSRSYERSYAELSYQRERLATLRGVDDERDGGMDLSGLAASLDLAADVMGVDLAEYLGDERFADVGGAVHSLFGRFAGSLSDAERETTDLFIASAGVEVSRKVDAARREVEISAHELREEHAQARDEYRARSAELLDGDQSVADRDELRELAEEAFGSALFVSREHQRSMLSLHSDAYERYDTIAYPRLAGFDRMHVESLAADLSRLVGGRYEAYMAARRNHLDLHRLDLATRRSEWEATMQAIRSRGARQWSQSVRRMNDRREAWIDRMQRGYEEGLERWEMQYLSLNEKRADWVEHAASAAAEVGSATVLESIGARADEAIAEGESVHIGALDTGSVDADELVAEALGGFDFDRLLSRATAINASISRGQPNILTSLGADRFADGEILHRIREARSSGSAEIEQAVSLVGAERARQHFVEIASNMERQIDRANETVERNTDRTFRDAGWSIRGGRFRRNTIVGDTVFSGAVRERHSVGRYRHFDDYDFGLHTDLSTSTLSRMTARGIEAQLDAAVNELHDELEEVFGEESESAETVAEAGESVEIDIERGWFASLFDIGDDSMIVRRHVDAVLQPGRFGEHVGYAPQLRPDIDFERGWRRSVLFPGAGQMDRLMGEFSYYQAMQAEGYEELNAGLHNTPLWDGEYAPTIRSVADVGVGIAGAFVTGGASLALSAGNAALWGAADVAGGDASLGEAVLGTTQAAAIGGVNRLAGVAGGAVNDVVGSRTLVGELAGNLAAAGVSNVGSGFVHAVHIDDVRGLGFSTEAFLETTFGDRALAGYAGSLAGDFAGGTVEGFSAEHAAEVDAVGGAIGSGVQAGLEYATTGETVLNIANLRDIGALAGQEWSSARLAELHLGGDGAALAVGRGGIDASISRAVDVAGGLGTFIEQQRMRGYDLFARSDIASAYRGHRRAGTALRSLYSYGDEEGRELRERILAGDTLLRVGYEDEFDASEFHQAFTESDREESTTVNLRTLGERGREGLSTRLIAGLTMQHEAHRDGYAVGDRQPNGTIVTHEQNTDETEAAVFGRLGMAERMVEDVYAEELLSDAFLGSEFSLYRAAQETDRLDVFGRYARVGYGAERDDFFAMVTSDGMYQNDWSMRDFLTVALLDGPSQAEVDEYNEAHRRDLYEQHVEEHGEHALGYEAFARGLIEQDEDLLDRYRYNPQQVIDVWSYGCALYSVGYMVNKATGASRNPIELNDAMRENGYYSHNSRGHGTLLSTGNIVAALNSFTDASTSFELADTVYNPGHVEFDRTHRSENEYFGYLRIAHPNPELQHAFPNGVHSEVVSEIETVTGADLSRDLLTGFVTTANPWDGSRAAPGSYLDYVGRTRRAFDEIQRMDLIEVHRHEYEEPYWSRLDLDSGW